MAANRVRQVMERAGPAAGNAYHYSATMPAIRNPADFTPEWYRFIPTRECLWKLLNSMAKINLRR